MNVQDVSILGMAPTLMLCFLVSSAGAVFRPIRDDGRPASVSSLASSASGMVPPSPTRSDTVSYSHPTWNVTGRGGGRADYRRRTLEYIDNNARAQAAAISRPSKICSWFCYALIFS